MLYIDGTFRDPVNGRTGAVLEKATGVRIGTYGRGEAVDVDLVPRPHLVPHAIGTPRVPQTGIRLRPRHPRDRRVAVALHLALLMQAPLQSGTSRA